MNSFHITKFNEGEEIVFGPVQTAHDSALGVHKDDNAAEITHTALRRVCVTNQRVVIENGDSSITLPNVDIRQVIVKHNRAISGASSFTLLYVRSRSGLRVRLDMPSLRLRREKELEDLFPNAEIKEENRGLRGLLEKLSGG